MAMAIEGAFIVGRDVLDQAAPQGDIEKLFAAADAQDGKGLFPGLAHEGNLQGVPFLVHVGAGMKECHGIPVPGMDIPPATEQETNHFFHEWRLISRSQELDLALPAA
jgi:hypothetical protein